MVKGTVNPGGPFSRGAQKGGAYVFRKSASTGLWYQDIKLFLEDGLGTDRYGWQVRFVPERVHEQAQNRLSLKKRKTQEYAVGLLRMSFLLAGSQLIGVRRRYVP